MNDVCSEKRLIGAVILFVLSFFSGVLMAQHRSDSLFVEGAVFPTYYFRGQALPESELGAVLDWSPAAMVHYREAQKFDRYCTGVQIGAALLFGYAFFEAYHRDSFNVLYSSGGLVLFSLSLPLSRRAHQWRVTAIRQYNQDLGQ